MASKEVTDALRVLAERRVQSVQEAINDLTNRLRELTNERDQSVAVIQEYDRQETPPVEESSDVE